MTGKTFKGNKSNYTAAAEIGRGGEGQVFNLTGNADLVLKIYNEAIPADKVRKLELMVAMASDRTTQYAAWPTDLVKDADGSIVGFVMRRLNQYVPLHMLFSPMDRKRIFPDKGYDFLVHVCRNLATAFYTLHSLDLVVGDVNEGNILVNDKGMVAFIDCDSFQIKDGSRYFYCEVGVPRYTPPELLVLTTFENVARTTNTDIFSMSILIFQLLFLGRHPFAGVNTTREDIDEETAIRQHLFAYSQSNRQKKLQPPVGSFAIANLPEGLVSLFHRSFEEDRHRPETAEWIKALDSLLHNLSRCSKSKAHAYPSQLSACPWCIFKEKHNIVYFIDDEFVEQLSALRNIEGFINGFRIEKLSFPPFTPAPASRYNIQVRDDYTKYRLAKRYHRLTLAGIILLTAGLSFISIYFLFFGAFIAAILHYALPWNARVQQELRRRQQDFADISHKLGSAIKEYEMPPDLRSYESKGASLNMLIQEFKRLPAELQQKKSLAEAGLYEQQLQTYLASFDIRDYNIPSIGTKRKLDLFHAGITNAADVEKLKTIKIMGFGPKFIQILFAWQRQMSSNFLYHPDRQALKRAYEQVAIQVDQRRSDLENQIKTDYQYLNYLKANIQGRQGQLLKYLDQLQGEYYRTEASLEQLKKAIR